MNAISASVPPDTSWRISWEVADPRGYFVRLEINIGPDFDRMTTYLTASQYEIKELAIQTFIGDHLGVSPNVLESLKGALHFVQFSRTY